VVPVTLFKKKIAVELGSTLGAEVDSQRWEWWDGDYMQLLVRIEVLETGIDT